MRLTLLVFILVLGYFTLTPLIRLQLLAFQGSASAYRAAVAMPGIWHVVLTTAELAFGSLAIAMVLGTGLAWAATLLSPRLRLLRILPILPIVIPALASILGWEFLLSPHPGYVNQLLRLLPWWHGLYDGPVNIYSLPWIIIISGFLLTSFIYLFVSAGLENINGELAEAARVSGSGGIGTFFRVTLPLLRPALVYGGGVGLLLGLGQFAVPLLLGSNYSINTLPTEMYYATQLVPANYGLAAALGSPLLVFGLALLVLNQFLIRDQTRFVTHGTKSFKTVRGTSKTAAGTITIFGLVAVLLPILSLVTVALSTYWSGDINPSTFTLASFDALFDNSQMISAIETSVTASLVAIAISLPIGFITASVLTNRRRHRFSAPVLDIIVSIPLCVPTVLFGVGFLYTYTRDPLILYGSKWLFILVYVAIMIPFSNRIQLAGMIGLGDAYSEASRVSGAGWLRTNLQILAPLMRSTFAAAAALMFILLANEFTASQLVRSPSTQVMGTFLYTTYGIGLYPQAACVALVMVAVTAIGVLIAVVAGGSDNLGKL